MANARQACAVLIAIGLSIFAAGCGSNSEPKDTEEGKQAKNCVEPENPYSEGTGHYAGYEWAVEHGGSCDTHSSSFNEGCEEYEEQEAKYEKCQAGH
jgi:hypothetical protein